MAEPLVSAIRASGLTIYDSLRKRLDLFISDEDSATGGPDPVRGIYPTVASITGQGFQRVEDATVAERFNALIERKTTEGHPT